jgi:autotransporter-associated beta strand protein
MKTNPYYQPRSSRQIPPQSPESLIRKLLPGQKSPVLAAIALSFGLLTGSADAASYTWNTGGSGNWDGTLTDTTRWGTAQNTIWNSSNYSNEANFVLASNTTVTVGAVYANRINFSKYTTTLSSGTIYLGGSNPTITTFDTAGVAGVGTINSVLVGNNVTINQAGSASAGISLGGSNSFTGTLTLTTSRTGSTNLNTISIANAYAAGSATVAIGSAANPGDSTTVQYGGGTYLNDVNIYTFGGARGSIYFGGGTHQGKITLYADTRFRAQPFTGNTKITGVIGEDGTPRSMEFGTAATNATPIIELGGNNTFTGGIKIGKNFTIKITNGGALNKTAGSENAVDFDNGGAGYTTPDGGYLQLNGTNVTVSKLTNSGATYRGVVENANATAATLTVGNSKNYTGDFKGWLRDGTGGGALGLTKAGGGTFTLSGSNSYTGVTTVNAGVLAIGSGGSINNTNKVSIGAGEFKYNSGTALSKTVEFAGTGGRLSGTGAISNFVSVTAGNTLAPGNSIGTVAFGNGLSLAGITEIELAAAGTRNTPGSSDRADVTGNLALGGTLALTNAGGAGVGSYKIFTYTGTKSGSFTDVSNVAGYRAAVADGGAGTGAGLGVFVDNYRLAAAAATQTVNIGNYHVGVGKTTALTIANTAAADATYTETLQTNGFSAPTNNFVASGTAGGIAGGGSDSGTLLVGAGASAGAGVQSATTVLSLQSNAVNGSGLGAANITGQTVTINGTGYRLASVNTVGDVNFGNFMAGNAQSRVLSGSNTAATGDSYSEKLDLSGAATDGATFSGGANSIAAGNSTSLTVALSSVTSGTHNGTVVLSATSNGTGTSGLGNTGLTGETIHVTGIGYDRANLSSNGLNLVNTGGTYTAAAKITGNTLTGVKAGNFAAAGTGNLVAASGSAAVATLNSNRLNGTYTATANLSFDNKTAADAAISGGTGDSSSVGVTATVTDSVSNNRDEKKFANLAATASYKGYGLTSGAGRGTTAELLGGTAAGDATVTMSFDSTSSVAGAGGFNALSDFLTLTGIHQPDMATPNLTDLFVLQLSYDVNFSGAVFIAYIEPGTSMTKFVNAVEGNSLLTSGSNYGDMAFSDAYLTLGNYGYDSTKHTAWAVIDHNSEFVVVPEPSTWAMVVGGIGMLAFGQRLRRRSAQ